MELRTVTKDEAERAFTQELSGDSFQMDGVIGAIVGIHLPSRPVPGGSQGKGFLPLTYEVKLEDGRVETIPSEAGPEVDELRAFLYATLPETAAGQRLEMWFERDPSDFESNLGCCC